MPGVHVLMLIKFMMFLFCSNKMVSMYENAKCRRKVFSLNNKNNIIFCVIVVTGIRQFFFNLFKKQVKLFEHIRDKRKMLHFKRTNT